jgi:hypothetical protein
MTENTNDNDAYPAAVRGPEPDAHGQAAMLLVESLIFGLIERAVISVRDAVEIVELAAEVKAEIAIDLGESPEALRRSLGLINSISSGLQQDIPGAEPL